MTFQWVNRLMGAQAMSVRCIALGGGIVGVETTVTIFVKLRLVKRGHLISFERPNFHSTSDAAWGWLGWLGMAADLDPLVGVRHHRDQQVDQHNSCDQHVDGKHQLEQVHQAFRVLLRQV